MVADVSYSRHQRTATRGERIARAYHCWRCCPDEPEHLVRPVGADAGGQASPIGATCAVPIAGVGPSCGVGVVRYAASFPIPVRARYGAHRRYPVSSCAKDRRSSKHDGIVGVADDGQTAGRVNLGAGQSGFVVGIEDDGKRSRGRKARGGAYVHFRNRPRLAGGNYEVIGSLGRQCRGIGPIGGDDPATKVIVVLIVKDRVRKSRRRRNCDGVNGAGPASDCLQL